MALSLGIVEIGVYSHSSGPTCHSGASKAVCNLTTHILGDGISLLEVGQDLDRILSSS